MQEACFLVIRVQPSQLVTALHSGSLGLRSVCISQTTASLRSLRGILRVPAAVQFKKSGSPDLRQLSAAAVGPGAPITGDDLSHIPTARSAPCMEAPAVAAPTGRSNCAAKPLPLAMTLRAVEVPPAPEVQRLGARVEHIMATRLGMLSSTVAEALSVPEWFVLELVRFGAVHWCPVPPLATGGAPRHLAPPDLQRLLSAREAAIRAHGKNPRLAVPKRVAADCKIDPWAYIRVHVHPKRFPAMYTVDWQARIVHVAESFVVVDKPAGVPVAPAVDNVLECCLAGASQAVGQGLLVTHRLDTATEGLVVLGRTAAFVQWFNGLLKQGRVRKFYRTLSASPPPQGQVVHYVTTGQRQQGEAAHTVVHVEEQPDSSRCELNVSSVRQVPLPERLHEQYGTVAYESVLELKTGRTHQIRAQFGACNAALIGDSMYATGICSAGHHAEGVAGMPTARRESGGTIGLQSWKLQFPANMSDITTELTFEASKPWWQ